MGRVRMVRDLMAELVMGRVCYGPSLSWTEFVMGRDVLESLAGIQQIQAGRSTGQLQGEKMNVLRPFLVTPPKKNPNIF